MKKLLTCLFLIITGESFSQTIEEMPIDESGTINFSEVVQVDSATKEQLFAAAKQFFGDTFKSAKDVIQVEDRDAGFIIGKAFKDIQIKILGRNSPTQMFYSMKIQAKEGRYKYEFYNIYYKSYPELYVPSSITKAEDLFQKENYFKKNGEPKDIPEKYKNQTLDLAKAFAIRIKAAMQKASATGVSKSKDW